MARSETRRPNLHQREFVRPKPVARRVETGRSFALYQRRAMPRGDDADPPAFALLIGDSFRKGVVNREPGHKGLKRPDVIRQQAVVMNARCRRYKKIGDGEIPAIASSPMRQFRRDSSYSCVDG